MISTLAIRALANERRLQILEWLKNPTKLPPQIDGDLVKMGFAAACFDKWFVVD
jgi:ArsR family transcriptional regulator